MRMIIIYSFPENRFITQGVIFAFRTDIKAAGLRSGDAVILPDEPAPDYRIVPLDEVPAGAVTYRVAVETGKGLP